MGESLLYVLKSFLKASEIKIDSDELKIQLLSHPSYPSLHALTGVLNHFGIPNVAVRLPIEERILDELTPVFIAQIQTGDAKNLVLVKKNTDSFDISYAEGHHERVSKTTFLSQFLGIVVVIENDNLAIETSGKHLKDYIFAGVILAVLYAQFLMLGPTLATSIYLLLAVLGLIISVVIFKQEQGETTIIGNAFCNSPDEKKDCNSVLNSDATHIFGTFKLSDICVIYFAASAVCMYLLQMREMSFSLLHITSFLALPITIYSIYYQKFVLKNWCALCLAIIVVLWAQAGSVLLTNDFKISISLNAVLMILIAYSVTAFIWSYVSRLIKSRKTLFDLRIEYLRFKKNFGLFKSALLSSDAIDTHVPVNTEIKFGNRASHLKIVVVSNPFCGHCKAVHTLIENILESYSTSAEITVRFNVNTNHRDGLDVAITSRIMELYVDSGQEVSLNAMHDIYGDLKPEAWLKKWGSCKNLDTYHSILEKTRHWCMAKDLNFTPVILINGRAYPKAYNRTDLIYFIEELEEDMEETLELQNSMA